jgi:hypothetical protein
MTAPIAFPTAAILLASTLAFGIVGMAGAAQAKTISMGTLSRSEVSSACARGNGGSFGIAEPQQPYGCRSGRGDVICSPSGSCVFSARDLMPLAGNSLDLLLGISAHNTGSRMIIPVDRRLKPTE